MAETVYRWMNVKELQNLVAGNWPTWEPLEACDIPEFEGNPCMRFSPDRERAKRGARGRGGMVSLDIEPLTDGQDYLRLENGDVQVLAFAVVDEPVTIEMLT